MNARYFLKRSIKMLFLLLMLPVYALYRMLALGGRRDEAFQSSSQFLSLIPGKLGIYMRAAFYRLACPNTSDEISIGFLTVLSHWDTTIHKNVYIGPQCNIGKCTIGEKTLLGSGVHILSGNRQHEFSDPDVPIQDQKGIFTKITIGRDCWLGNQALVMANLAERSILAAGTVYIQEYPEPGAIMAGNPAKLIRKRVQGGARHGT